MVLAVTSHLNSYHDIPWIDFGEILHGQYSLCQLRGCARLKPVQGLQPIQYSFKLSVDTGERG